MFDKSIPLVIAMLLVFSCVIGANADNFNTSDSTESFLSQAKVYLTDGEYNIKKAESLLQQAASRGAEEAYLILGRLYTRDQEKKDFTAASFWLKKAADQESTKAMNMMALLYLDGRVVEPDKTKAAYWVQRGSDAGDLDATYNLANFYLEGEGVTRDRDEAIRLLKYAAEKGHQYSIDYFVEQAKNNDADAIAFLNSLPTDAGQ